MASGNAFLALTFIAVSGSCLFVLGWFTYEYPLVAAAAVALAALIFIARGVLS